jgi:hypothetical protein
VRTREQAAQDRFRDARRERHGGGRVAGRPAFCEDRRPDLRRRRMTCSYACPNVCHGRKTAASELVTVCYKGPSRCYDGG